jgi:uncharacterized protein DUF3551
MRTMALGLGIAALALAAGVQPAAAEITYPWCAEYSDDNTARNCGFLTLEQCQAAISGNGGYCEANPLYRPAADAPRQRKPRR